MHDSVDRSAASHSASTRYRDAVHFFRLNGPNLVGLNAHAGVPASILLVPPCPDQTQMKRRQGHGHGQSEYELSPGAQARRPSLSSHRGHLHPCLPTRRLMHTCWTREDSFSCDTHSKAQPAAMAKESASTPATTSGARRIGGIANCERAVVSGPFVRRETNRTSSSTNASGAARSGCVLCRSGRGILARGRACPFCP